MSPKESAAAESPRTIVGSTQNDGVQAHSSAPVKVRKSIVSGNDWAGIVTALKNRAARSRGTAEWSFRSPVPSEDRRVKINVIAAAQNGIAESIVDEMIEYP